MNLTSSRRADEFSRLLEDGVSTDDPTAAPMLALTAALQALPTAPGPRPEFRQALRQRLVAVATVQGVGAPAETPMDRAREAGRTWRVQRRLTALAAGAAVVTGVTGVGLGASRSLPGDPFYGVKRAAEGVQLATTTGTEARGKRHLEFARTRLSEVEALAGHSSSMAPTGDGRTVAAPALGGSRTSREIDTLHAMDVETRDGANDLLAAYQQSGSLEPLQALNRFTAEQYARLRDLLPSLPTAAQPSARASLALLSVVATRTVERAQSGTTGTPTPTTPGQPTVTPAPTATGGGGSKPSPGTTGQPGGTGPGGTKTQTAQPLPTSNPLPTSLPTSLPSSLPTSLPTVPVLPGLTSSPLPAISTIPPLPLSTPLPTVLPTLTELPSLPGLGG